MKPKSSGISAEGRVPLGTRIVPQASGVGGAKSRPESCARSEQPWLYLAERDSPKACEKASPYAVQDRERY